MRRTRWDQKPEIEEPVASSSQWNSQCTPTEWNHHNRAAGSMNNDRDPLSTPRPLDYSSDSRQRNQESVLNEDNKNKTESSQNKDVSKTDTDQPTIYPPPWSYMPNFQHIYPGSSQNTQMPYAAHSPWNQSQQGGFYPRGEFHGEQTFDLKWWEEQRDLMNAHLGMQDGSRSKDQQQKYDHSRSGNHWSLGTRVLKQSDRSFDYAARRYQNSFDGRSSNTGKNFRDFRILSPQTNGNRFNNVHKIDRRQPLLPFRDSQSQSRFWRDYAEQARPQDYSQTFRQNISLGANNGGFIKKNSLKVKSISQSALKDSSKKSGRRNGKKMGLLKQKEKEIKNDSAAEKAKKKALAAAATKLKQTFLAAKKNPESENKSSRKAKEPSKVKNSVSGGVPKSRRLIRKLKAHDLSVPRSIPKEGTSLEHDIDIKFSAHEWESVGRGEGGTRNILPPVVGSRSKDSDNANSDSDSVQTIEDDDDDDIESIKPSSDNDNESEMSDLYFEEDDDIIITDSEQHPSSTPVRRRHASESITIDAADMHTNHTSTRRRVRSYSTSQVEQGYSGKRVSKESPLTSNLKKMLIKQLLTMDKKSLKELVDDPKSRKAQFMMNHFVDMHRNALSQKLNQLRFKSTSSFSNAEDLNVLQAFNPTHLEELPSYIIQQVKEILELEAEGTAHKMWEEVSLSLSDLISGFDGLADKEEEKNKEQLTPSYLGQCQKAPTLSPQDDLDCQIVTPPPKIPATTITIPDSDNEIPSDVLTSLPCRPPPLLIRPPVAKSLSPSSPRSSSSSPHPNEDFIKPQDLTRPDSSPLPHPDRPPNPLPRSSSPLPHILTPAHALKQSPHPDTPLPAAHPDRPPNPLPRSSSPLPHILTPAHALKQSPHPDTPLPAVPSSPPFIPPSPPSIDAKRIKIPLKNKIADVLSELLPDRDGCNVTLEAPQGIKVKQERPSPMMECGLCLHPPRSPHTPQCAFAFGIPPHPVAPVALMPGAPRPLGTVPPQRPVPQLASSVIPSIFKQERPAGTYLNPEHVNRPSSEERPKNPAPPDNANSEPPSPLPIPPPQSTLHQPPPPRPLIFSPEEQFAEPPRPPSPPPPQHSPRIKMERQTPQFICCCMRNECERNNSRQSADFRRGDTTPQGPQHQLCESAMLRATPHSVYKYEPPYLSTFRHRLPKGEMVNMFTPVSPSPTGRCLTNPNGPSVIPGLLSPPPNPRLSVVPATHVDAALNSKINVGIQTDSKSPSRSFAPNVSLARSVTPIANKMDQTTSTVDLTRRRNTESSSSDEERPYEGKQRRRPSKRSSSSRPCNSSNVSTSTGVEDHVSSVVNKLNDWRPSGPVASQLLQLTHHENETLLCLDVIERKERELARERTKLKETLHKINELRYERIVRLQDADEDTKATSSSSQYANNRDFNPIVMPLLLQNNHTNDNNNVVSNSLKNELPFDKTDNFHSSAANLFENQSMVSSSQEVHEVFKNRVSPSGYLSNDSQSHSVQGQRCTSTSLLERKDSSFMKEKESSDSEGENKENVKKHKYRLGKQRFMGRRRMNSGSTSDEFQDEKIKVEPIKSPLHSNQINAHLNNSLPDNLSDIELKEEVVADTSTSNINVKEELVKKDEELEFGMEGTSVEVKEENEHICNISSNRKGSITGSPQSPKMRNSSGSEHGYSLRSRGPPSDLFDFNSDSQLSKDTQTSSQDDQIEINDEKRLCTEKIDDEQADQLEKEGVVLVSDSKTTSGNENSFTRRKRKRKTKYHVNKYRKRGNLNGEYSSGKSVNAEACSSSSTGAGDLPDAKKELQQGDPTKEDSIYTQKMERINIPPPHSEAVLDMKVVGNLIFTASSDMTARLFDPASGVVLSTYQGHLDSVTAIQVIGEPQFTVGSPGFQVVTGSEDRSIHVYEGKTGVLTQKRICSESVRCLEYRWGYLFIGTDGGCGLKWNLKDKRLGEKVQFCGKGITRLLAHVEGGRKVLVVGAKTTPIMIRDAMSGLFLRTLDYVQLTMYAGVFEGNLLYTGGADKNIFVYDYCGGSVKERFYAEASVSGLILLNNFLVATCYDGSVRIFKLPKGDLIHSIPVESSHNMFICSALYRNKILLGNKNGEIVSCELPNSVI